MDKTTPETLSIIIPAYNEGGIIDNSIARVLQVLDEQEHYEWELILVDDGSSDGTNSIIEAAAAGRPGCATDDGGA